MSLIIHIIVKRHVYLFIKIWKIAFLKILGNFDFVYYDCFWICSVFSIYVKEVAVKCHLWLSYAIVGPMKTCHVIRLCHITYIV